MRKKTKTTLPQKTEAPTEASMEAVLMAYRAGRLDQALGLARAMAQQFPHHPFGWKALGVILQESGHREAALPPLQRAVRLAPDDAEGHYNLGVLLKDQGRPKQAAQSYRNAIAINPHHAQAHNNLGVALDDQGEPLAAKACYLQALRLKPDYTEAHNNLGDILMAQGQWSAALACLRQALALQIAQPLPPPQPASSHVFNRPEIEALMWQTLVQLAKAGIHAFPMAGTLLGLEREGHLLPFDKDLDFGLPFEERAAASSCLQAQGWVPINSKLRMVNPLNFRHAKTGLVLDIFGFLNDIEHGVLISGFWQEGQPWSVQRVTQYPAPLCLCEIERREGRMWALQDPHRWLTTLYGETWRIPDPHFDSVLAAKNLRGFSVMTKCYGFMRIAQYIREGKPEKALATARHCLRHLPEDALLQKTIHTLGLCLETAQ